MATPTPFILTISRQMGSGGSYIGQHIAKALNMHYADREIIRKVSQQMESQEEEIDQQDEKVKSIWNYFVQFSAFSSDAYIPPRIIAPTARELFEAEAEVIGNISKEYSAVIIGRCGFHILKNHPNHLSIFLYGDIKFRAKRIMELYKVNEANAIEMIIHSDKDRARYNQAFTGKSWTDALQYNLSLDTSVLGLDESIQLILQFIKQRNSII